MHLATRFPFERRTRPPRRRLGWVAPWLRDSGLVLFTQIGVTAMTTVLIIVVARRLGPEQFGIFSGFVGFSQAFSLAADVGLAAWLLRELSGGWQGTTPTMSAADVGRLLRDSLSLNAALGMPLVVLAAVGGVLAGLSLYLVLLLVGLMAYVVLVAAAAGLEAALRSQRRIGMVVIGSVIEKIVLLGCVLAALHFNLGLTGIACAYVLAGLSRVSFAAYKTVWSLPAAAGESVARNRLPSLARRALPFAVNAAAFNFVPRLDNPLVTAISARQGGYFAVAYQIVSAVVVIPVIASTTLYPFMANRSNAGMRLIYGAFALAGATAAVVGIVSAPDLIPLLFGPKFGPGVSTSQCVLISLPLIFFANGLLVGIYVRGLERELVLLTIPAAIAGSVAVGVGAYWAGGVGAGLGYAVRYALFAGGMLGLLACRSNPSGQAPERQGAWALSRFVVPHVSRARPARAHRRTRRSIPRWGIVVLRPLFRYSVARDAYVLRIVGRQRGPVLIPTTPAPSRDPPGDNGVGRD